MHRDPTKEGKERDPTIAEKESDPTKEAKESNPGIKLIKRINNLIPAMAKKAILSKK